MDNAPIRPIKLIEASCTFSCLFLRIGVIRGTAMDEEVRQAMRWEEIRRQQRLTEVLDRRVHLGHSDHVGDGCLGSDDTENDKLDQ